MNYLVSDFIIRIKNSASARRKEVVLPYSKLNREIGKTLVKAGYLEDIKLEELDGKKSLKAVIKYHRRLPVLTTVNIISKPSLRVYSPSKKLTDIEKRGKKTLIISTSSGVMTGKEAIKKGLGGEVLFAVS